MYLTMLKKNCIPEQTIHRFRYNFSKIKFLCEVLFIYYVIQQNDFFHNEPKTI